MLLTVFCALRDRSETTFALDVSPELELRDFLALCELESGIPAGEIQISYAEQPLRDPTRPLGNYGLKDGDVVVLRQAERRPPAQPVVPGLPRIDFSSIAVPGTSLGTARPPPPTTQQPSGSQATSPAVSPQGLDNPTLLRDMLLANPHELSLLKERNPPLAEALLSGDLERFTKVLLEQQQDRARREQERIRLLTADPFDLDAQAKIEEDIRQHNIEENMTIAMEEAPESFGQVVMLYINCKVNGHPVKAFVDSGAQMTIMSQACAERCNIMRLVDRRWAGIAKGVGTQKIIGRVHLAQVQIEGDFLPCSFSILEDQPMDMLLGLDMLKRHQCSIDLKKSVLLIGTTGTETRFLPEAELPECARLAYGPEGRDEARPEEIADRELAEALQRSVQDSDTADGKTTSPKSPPLSLCKPFSTPTTSSSATSHTKGFTLDRSKSAPASIHESLPSEASFSPSETQVEIKLQPSDTQGMAECKPSVSEAPATSTPQPLKVLEFSQNPNPGPSDAFEPQSQPVTNFTPSYIQETEALSPSILPAQEPFSSTVSKDNEGTNLATCGESLIQSDGGKVTLQETKETDSPFTNLDTCSQSGASLQEVDMADVVEAKRIDLDIPDQFQQSEQDSMINNVENNQVDQFTAVTPSELTFHNDLAGPASSAEQSLVQTEFEAHMDTRPVSDSSERDKPEVDNIPSLAQALKELHELLMSNSHAQASGSGPPSDSHLTTTRQDEWVNQDLTTENCAGLNPAVDDASSSHTATTNETNFAKSEHAALAKDDASVVPTVSSQGHEGNHANVVANSSVEQDTQSLHLSEANQVGGKGEGLVSQLGEEPSLQGSFELREATESQQGRGDANGKNTATDSYNSAEPSQQRPLSVANGSSADDSSHVPVASSSPLTQAHESAPHPFVDSIQPSTLTLMGQYPPEHIQRIQAAGFSSHEAAEALERAEGSVELALLVLLARKITVPT